MIGRKKFISILVILTLLISILSPAALAETSSSDIAKITILHTNDTHARVDSTTTEIGFAKIATLVADY